MAPFKFNPITSKLDMVNSTSGLASTPQSGLLSPEGSATARYAGDQYVNSATGILYTNPTSGSTVGREIVQTQAA